MEPPDRLEKCVRFGCGFLFGCVVGAGALLTSLWNAHYILASIVALGVPCGYAAVKFGDSFWDTVRRWWWW